MNNTTAFSRLAKVTYLLVPGLVVCSIWAPVITHYHIRPRAITDQLIHEARQSPPDSVLSELEQFRLVTLSPDERQLIPVAEKLLDGIVDLPGYPVARVSVPFDSRDLAGVPPAWRLPVASLVVPRILLDAYVVTDREEFLLTARDMIIAWGRYERRAWLPTGLMWNDHAAAARIGVLIELWRLYRHHPTYQPQLAREILEQVNRTAALLAEPHHFTFATNHGIMQNAALLQVSVAFPMMPEVDRYKDLALGRLRDQMAFFVDDEGVVLEHSAGYQRWGLELIGMICRSLTLLHQPIPDDWRRKYERAKDVFAALRRRDGSLPTFGDTDGASDDLGPHTTVFDSLGHAEPLRLQSIWTPARSLNFYPIAGHAIWWDGLEPRVRQRESRQTVVTWSYFPGHAHKSADEMSVLVWSGGRPWWTTVGYWPYETAGRAEATSWQSGNAPHLVDESPLSARRTSVLSHGWSDRLGVIDLERTGPGRYVARRQVVHLKPETWLIVDHVSGGAPLRTTTTWTTSPDVTLRRDGIAGSYVLEARQSPLQLRTFILSSRGTTIRQFQGSWSPFAGWQVIAGAPRPAPAVVVEQPADDSWSIVVWSLEDRRVDSSRRIHPPRVSYWHHAEDWNVELDTRSGPQDVGRDGNRMTVRDARTGGVIATLGLTAGPDVAPQVARLSAFFANAARAYPRFQDQLARRSKVTQLLLVLLLCQEIFFGLLKRKFLDHYGSLRVLSLFGWIGVGCWLALSLLKG